ncbi:MAG: RDD family protein [Bacteroidota bacterium]
MIFKRIVAYLIDCVIIFFYAASLFAVNYLTHQLLDKPFEAHEPIKGHIISFFTMTLPVFLYFFLFEIDGKKRGTLGKRLMKLEVVNNSTKNVFIRVLLKLLPWEIAHFGMHWSTHYYSQGIEAPNWVWLINILPQILVLIYLISLIYAKGTKTIYDRFAKTEVRRINGKRDVLN